jgi:uncharacterized protein YuzE
MSQWPSSRLILSEGAHMKIEFDQAADALYVQLAEGEIEKTEEIKPGMILDYDANGNVLGVELLYVSKRAELPIKKAA